MGLRKEVCWKCLIGHLKGRFVGDAFDDEGQARMFDKDWKDGRVWCSGIVRLSLLETPLCVIDGRLDFSFDSFAMVDGSIPGCCLDKRGQLGEVVWGRFEKCLAAHGELSFGEVAVFLEDGRHGTS